MLIIYSGVVRVLVHVVVDEMLDLGDCCRLSTIVSMVAPASSVAPVVSAAGCSASFQWVVLKYSLRWVVLNSSIVCVVLHSSFRWALLDSSFRWDALNFSFRWYALNP